MYVASGACVYACMHVNISYMLPFLDDTLVDEIQCVSASWELYHFLSIATCMGTRVEKPSD